MASAPSANSVAAAPVEGDDVTVSVHGSFAEAAVAWRELERIGLLTPYQRLAFAEAWWREIGRREGVTPLIVVGRGPSGAPRFLWPLGRRRYGPFSVAEPFGGKHANFHFGPWTDEQLARGAAGLRAALRAFAAAAPRVDALLLPNQTKDWLGRPNPFAMLPAAAPSPSNAYRARLDGSAEAYMQRVMSHDGRKQVRAKTRKFEAMPGFRMGRAASPAEMEILLDGFLQQKATQFADMGVADPFAAAGTRDFLRSLTRAGGDGGASLDLYGLWIGGQPVAIMGGLGDGERFSGMFMSHTPGAHAKLTPGYVLTAHVVADLCRRGYQTFDLGVGEARYKSQFCDETEELVDVCVPLTLAGHVFASGARQTLRVKRGIKRSPYLWSAVNRLRRLTSA